MFYEFPGIYHIDDVLPAIEGRDEFVVASKPDYTVINYNVMMADTFPAIEVEEKSVGWGPLREQYKRERYHRMIRRECRGIIFDSTTGVIIRRPYHKFFNVNEREETQDHHIDMSRPHVILEKLDGSMIAPFIVNGRMIWGTKMGATDVAEPVEKFVNEHSFYCIFANDLIRLGLTPIFEWCSRKQRIVLDYVEDRLVLTAIRDMTTGEYLPHEEMIGWARHYGQAEVNGGIPVVRVFEPQSDMKAFLEYVNDLQDVEGFVIRFDDGSMVKAKCHWYVQIHKAKEAILQDRNIVELILDEALDDVKAHLPEEDRDRLTQFESNFNRDLLNLADAVSYQMLIVRNSNVSRKEFALEHASKLSPHLRAVSFKLWDDYSVDTAVRVMRETLRNNLSRTVKYENIRDEWFGKYLVYNT